MLVSYFRFQIFLLIEVLLEDERCAECLGVCGHAQKELRVSWGEHLAECQVLGLKIPYVFSYMTAPKCKPITALGS